MVFALLREPRDTVRVSSRQRRLPKYEAALAVLSLWCTACDEGGHPTVAQRPESRTVEIAANTVQVGFAIGVIREPKEVSDFTISRYPVTRGEFLACVQAGACAKSSAPRCLPSGTTDRLDRPTIDDDRFPDEAPATCVGLDEAQKYCSWAGGQLPTLEQWMLAARGPAVSRYAWGVATPTCQHHPRTADREKQIPCELNDPAPLEVGKHPAGASPLGLHDVLLTRAELLRTSKESVFGPCRPPEAGANANAPSSACLVYGLEAGAIDSVQQMPPAAAAEDGRPPVEVSPRAYGFRCVWGGEVSK